MTGAAPALDGPGSSPQLIPGPRVEASGIRVTRSSEDRRVCFGRAAVTVAGGFVTSPVAVDVALVVDTWRSPVAVGGVEAAVGGCVAVRADRPGARAGRDGEVSPSGEQPGAGDQCRDDRQGRAGGADDRQRRGPPASWSGPGDDPVEQLPDSPGACGGRGEQCAQVLLVVPLWARGSSSRPFGWTPGGVFTLPDATGLRSVAATAPALTAERGWAAYGRRPPEHSRRGDPGRRRATCRG
jgi:hypothetical protein